MNFSQLKDQLLKYYTQGKIVSIFQCDILKGFVIHYGLNPQTQPPADLQLDAQIDAAFMTLDFAPEPVIALQLNSSNFDLTFLTNLKAEFIIQMNANIVSDIDFTEVVFQNCEGKDFTLVGGNLLTEGAKSVLAAFQIKEFNIDFDALPNLSISNLTLLTNIVNFMIDSNIQDPAGQSIIEILNNIVECYSGVDLKIEDMYQLNLRESHEITLQHYADNQKTLSDVTYNTQYSYQYTIQDFILGI